MTIPWMAIETASHQTAEPEMVRKRLERLLASHQEQPERLQGLLTGLNDPLWRQRLVAILGNSPFLSHLLTRWPEWVADWQASAWSSPPADRTPLLLAQAEGCHHQETMAAHLRHYKHREYLRIAMRDLTNEAPLAETTRDLSQVAEGCLEAARFWLERWLQTRHGRPMVTSDGTPRPARFVILGMGKLGARELNYASDIDLIYLYDADGGATDGEKSLSLKTYYIRLGQEIIKILQEPTADGRVFRVDLRLRPEGESGDLAGSLRSAEIYYESWGQTWERAALIKARPVAGDLALGESFLASLKPFVYRRFLDFGALEAIREMKHKIDRKVGEAGYRHHLKLGRGGIREIEFFVQSHQLIHGGKRPELRLTGTVATLHQLARLGLIEKATAETLTEGYTWLRHAEHRLQMVEDEQTHTLPQDAAGLTRLAKRLGLATATALQERLDQVRGEVHRLYGQLFHESKAQAEQARTDPLVERILGGLPDEQQCLAVMQKFGFVHPEEAVALLPIVREGPRGTALTESARRRFSQLAPRLLQEIRKSPDPDMALHHAVAFLQRMGPRPSYLAMLLENAAVLGLLVKLFGTSGLMSRYLTHHPELMDHLVSRIFTAQLSDRSTLAAELTRLMAEAADEEERMRVIRRFKNTELLRLGLRDLAGVADLQEVMAGLSVLAEVIVAQVVLDARADMERRHGIPHWTDAQGVRQRAHFAVVAMGKLGAGELNYSSDLDLLFVHDSAGEEACTEGSDRPLANGLYFARLGQKILTWITTLTDEGKLYELDMRLRPSGNAGPLVISVAALVHYHRHDAWTWEHQALTRARPVAGDPVLLSLLRQEITALIRLRRDPAWVAGEVHTMRKRLAREKPPPAGWIDIKQSRGGIVDIEFLVQSLILSYAADHPRVVQRNLGAALWAIRQVGWLDASACEVLQEAYHFYRLVENRLRLLHDRSENRIGPDPRVLARLAVLLALPSGDELIGALTRRLDEVHAIYRRYLGPEPMEEATTAR